MADLKTLDDDQGKRSWDEVHAMNGFSYSYNFLIHSQLGISIEMSSF